jgi:hypothetical protein
MDLEMRLYKKMIKGGGMKAGGIKKRVRSRASGAFWMIWKGQV